MKKITVFCFLFISLNLFAAQKNESVLWSDFEVNKIYLLNTDFEKKFSAYLGSQDEFVMTNFNSESELFFEFYFTSKKCVLKPSQDDLDLVSYHPQDATLSDIVVGYTSRSDCDFKLIIEPVDFYRLSPFLSSSSVISK